MALDHAACAQGKGTCTGGALDSTGVPRDSGKQMPDNPVLRCRLGQVPQPVPGAVIPITRVSDPVFAREVLGMSVAIRPSEGIVFAPIGGQLVLFSPTGHAIGLRGDNGMELLIHVGIDTVKMNGNGFVPLAAENDRVKAGQKLLAFSPAAIREAGFDDTVMVIMVNSRNFPEAEAILDASI